MAHPLDHAGNSQWRAEAAVAWKQRVALAMAYPAIRVEVRPLLRHCNRHSNDCYRSHCCCCCCCSSFRPSAALLQPASIDSSMSRWNRGFVGKRALLAAAADAAIGSECLIVDRQRIRHCCSTA